MIKYYLTYFLIFSYISLALSQNNLLFDSEPFYAEKSDIEITFERFDNQVVSTVKESTILISNRSSTKIELYQIHDDESSITSFNQYKLKGNKKKFQSIEKRCYHNFSDEVFSSDYELCVYNLSIDGVGQKKMYKTEKKYYDLKYFVDQFITDPFPFKEKTIKITVPNWLDVEFVELNLNDFNFDKTKTLNKKGDTEFLYSFKDLRSEIDEENSFGPTYTEPHIVFVFNSFINKKGEKIDVLSSIQDMYNWYESLVNSVDNKKSELTPFVEDLIKNEKTELNKAKKIFYWVQDNIKYIAFEDGIMGFKPEGAASVFQNRYGDCKGMANLTKILLQIAGIDARITWVGTHHISDAYNYSFPSLANDNHMICTAIINGKYYFLDPTEDYISLGDYASRIQGRKVLIENGKGYLLKKVPSFSYKHNKKTLSSNLKVSGNSLIGDLEITYTGEIKTYLLWQMNYTSGYENSDKMKNILSDHNSNLHIEGCTFSNMEDREKPVSSSCEINIQNHVTSFEDELYIALNINRNFDQIKIDKDRDCAYNLYYKPYEVDQIKLAVPEGYKISYIPDSISIDNIDYTVKMYYSIEQNNIILNKEFIFKTGEISKNSLFAWISDNKKISAFFNDQIILKKT